ncbi:MAG TPA: hypothetical protein ENK04_01465 [Gammaproteobacteria bacterium]|nr:hypothetical protein [Gammaproteobacteria bacterium]
MRMYTKEKLPPAVAKKNAATITPGAAKKNGDRSEVRAILQENVTQKKERPVPESTGAVKEVVSQVERKNNPDDPETG